LVYDGDASRPGGIAGGLQTWRDGRMQAPCPKVPCKWVPVDAPEAVAVNVPEWAADFNSTGTPPGYPVGFEVRYTLGGTEGHYVAVAAGQLPAPTDPVADANWRRVASPMPATALFQVMPYAVALSYDGDDQLTRGREYLITERGAGKPDVRGTFSCFAPARMQYATVEGQLGAFTYDLASDAATATVAYDDTQVRAELLDHESRIHTLEGDLVDLENEVGGLTTDDISEGSALFFTEARAVLAKLAGYAKSSTSRAITAADSIKTALGILEKKADDNAAAPGRFTIQDYSGDFGLVALTAGRVLQNSTATDIKCTVFGSGLNGLAIGTKFYLRRTGTGKLTITPTLGGDNVVPTVDYIGTTADVPLNAMYVLLLLGSNHWQVSNAEASGVEASGSASGPWPPFTDAVTDDVNKVFKATLPANFRTTAAEYTTDGGTTTTIATEAMRSGNVLSAPVAGSKTPGTVGWRLRA
ncbi:hypothetical protein, partial [Hymenobacter agri]